MDYKEEYQKALERARKGLPIDEVFPELKESEDERIRKELIEAIERARVFDIDKEVADRWISYLEKQKEQERIVPEREATDFEIEVHEIIAQARSDKRLADKDVLEQFEKEASCALMWKAEKQLRNAEKQKEQKDVSASTMAPGCWQGEEKSAEWSDEDEVKLNDVIRLIENSGNVKSIIKHYTDFLKALPERFSLQPKQEWSEEDEKMFNSLCTVLHGGLSSIPTEQYIYWLKSLSPQFHWKPSEEQMKALLSMLPVVKGSGDKVQDILESLYNDLSKL